MTGDRAAAPAIIVGAGLMGRWHAHAVAHAGGRVTAIVDTDIARAGAIAAGHEGAATAASLEEALRTSDAPLVHICTPVASHADLARTALAAGRHVLVEKPFARSAAEAGTILDAARDRQRLAAPVHQFLFQHGVLEAQESLSAIGPLRHLELAVSSAGAEAAPATADAVAVEILPHLVALAGAFSRSPITAGKWQLERPAPGELLVLGVVGDLGVTGRVSMRGRPPMNELRLVGERGTTVVDLFHGFAVADQATTSRTDKALRPFRTAALQAVAATINLARRGAERETAYPGLRELVRRFHRAALDGTASPITADDTRAVMTVWSRLVGNS